MFDFFDRENIVYRLCFNSVYIKNSLEVRIYNYGICDLIYSRVSSLIKRFAYFMCT